MKCIKPFWSVMWIIAAIVFVAVLVASCGGKRCIHSHTEYNIVMQPFMIGKDLIMIPELMPLEVCDRYQQEKPK